MDQVQDIVVHAPKDKFQIKLQNVPKNITAKDLILLLRDLDQFKELKMNFRVKNVDGCSNPNDIINGDVYLINSLDTVTSIEKASWKIMDSIFYIIHFVSIVFLMKGKHIYSLAFFIFGITLYIAISHINTIPNTLYGNIIDGIRMFFISAFPNFNIADATKHD